MLKDDVRLFREWKKPYENDYAAVVAIAKKARSLANKTDNAINHSEALTWALTGEVPGTLRDAKIILNRKKYVERFLNDTLSEIDDIFVRMSVKKSFYKSLENREITYTYINLIEEPKLAKVRILVNMLWDKLNNPKEEQ